MTSTHQTAAGWLAYCRCDWTTGDPATTQHAARVAGDAHLADENRPWPRTTNAGRIVWACCVSSIGPKCRHMTTPEEDRLADQERDRIEAARRR